MKLNAIVFLLLSWVPPCCAQVAWGDGCWLPEDTTGLAEVSLRGDTLDVVAPDGLCLWYTRRLEGNYEITYRAQVVAGGGKHDRLADLNCFWAAADPSHPNDFFARSRWRGGVFTRYNSLRLFYVGYGGNGNTTTRFRKYHPEYYGKEDGKVKPLLKEYVDAPHLLEANHWYGICIRVANGVTTYGVDGRELFSHPLAEGEGDGYFALRLWQNHVQVTGFTVQPFDGKNE